MQNSPGALIDTRSSAQKEKDFRYDEVYTIGASPVEWREKAPSEWHKYPVRDQAQSGSCVAQTVAKMLGIKNFREEGRFIDFSAVPIYQGRSNKPYAGMIGDEALNLAVKVGSTPEILLPSQHMSDAQMDAQVIKPSDKQIGQIFRQKSYMTTALDIDTIAAMIDEEGCSMFWTYFHYDEWQDVPKVLRDINIGAQDTLRHSITGVDKTLYQGQKAIIIEDSWGDFNQWHGQRVITESWLAKRKWYSAVLTDLDNSWRDKDLHFTRPHYTWSRRLSFSMVADLDVKKLQEVLRYEELFPFDTDLTGNYGSLTAKGVLALQKRYKIAPDTDLDALAGRSVGPLTLELLNKIYG